MSTLVESVKVYIVPAGFVFFKVAFTLIAGFFLIKYLSKFIRVQGARHKSPYLSMILSKSVYYIGWFLIIMSALSQFGINTTQILGAAGILGVALGFASQTSVSNIISGIFLVAEKPYVIGDRIQVGDIVGKVASIDLLSVKLVTSDNDFIRIPNEFLIKNSFINLTKFHIRRIGVELSVGYDVNLETVLTTLNAAVHSNSFNHSKDKSESLVTSFGLNAITLTAYMWVSPKHVEAAKSKLMLDIKKRFEKDGIQLLCPQVIIQKSI